MSRVRARLVNQRLRLLFLLILLTFGALAARTAYLQTVRASSLAAAAQAQTKTTVAVPAARGTIFDRMGIPLAIGEQAIDVIADPMQITAPARTARTVAKVLGLRLRPLVRALSQHSNQYYIVEHQVSPTLAAVLENKHLTGFTYQQDEQRSYPQGTVAAPVLGYMGFDRPLGGLELELNRALAGRPGKQVVVKDALQQVVETQPDQPVRNGKNVFLTVDSHIQANAEQILEQTVAQYHAKDATAIVMDPRTGAILAMAQEPGYDANSYPQASTRGLTLDHAVGDVFEPGSVFKVVTIGGALSQHDITPNSVFTVPGSLHVADRVIHDAESHGTERLHVWQILQRSSNIGTDEIARKYLGQAGMLKWMARFGFGKRTGVDFPGRELRDPAVGAGPVPRSAPSPSARAFRSPRSSSRRRTRPLRTAESGSSRTSSITSPARPARAARHRRMLAPGVDRELRHMLKGVVSDQGTAALAEIPGYSVAGKTGTAQKPGPYGYLPGSTSRRSSAWCRRARRGSSSATSSTSRRGRSTAASSRRRRLSRSRRSTSSTSAYPPVSLPIK